MKAILKKFLFEEKGLETVEYALMLVLLALVAIVGATAVGNAVSAKFTEAANTINPTQP